MVRFTRTRPAAGTSEKQLPHLEIVVIDAGEYQHEHEQHVPLFAKTEQHISVVTSSATQSLHGATQQTARQQFAAFATRQCVATVERRVAQQHR